VLQHQPTDAAAHIGQIVEWRRHDQQRLRLAALGLGEAAFDRGPGQL
jgi:hypothetical protein